MAEARQKSAVTPVGEPQAPKRILSGSSVVGGPPLHIPLASATRPELHFEGSAAVSPTSSKAAKPPPIGELRKVSSCH